MTFSGWGEKWDSAPDCREKSWFLYSNHQLVEVILINTSLECSHWNELIKCYIFYRNVILVYVHELNSRSHTMTITMCFCSEEFKLVLLWWLSLCILWEFPAELSQELTCCAGSITSHQNCRFHANIPPSLWMVFGAGAARETWLLMTDEMVSLNKSSEPDQCVPTLSSLYCKTVVLTHFLLRPMSLSWPHIPFRRERAISDFVDRHIDTYWKRSAEDYSRPCRPGPLLHLHTGLLDMWRQFSFHSLSIWRRRGGTWAGNCWTSELRAAVTQRAAHMLGCFTSAGCGWAQGAFFSAVHLMWAIKQVVM